jgi:hypothetical protein
LLTQGAVFLIHLPVFYLLYSLFNLNPMMANLVAFVAVASIRYLLSEQWVWTRSAMTWQAQSFTYNLHNLLRIESQVPLRELDYFSADFADSDADIQIRVDRQGTPTSLPGGISYDDQLGRFGFGLTVLPGQYTQIIVSPLLEHSPDFLYTNVIEPVLRWRLLQEGCAMVKAACVADGDQAMLITADQDLGAVVSRLCQHYNYVFLADDLTILNAEGAVFCYPKPLTVEDAMLDSTDLPQIASNRLLLVGQRLLYTRFVRRIGLWLSEQDLPAATFNTYLQRFIPQPKEHLQKLYPDIKLHPVAKLSELFLVTDRARMSGGPDLVEPLRQSETLAAFQPHPLLAEKLRMWGEEDLAGKEQAIIFQAISSVPARVLSPGHESWWMQIRLHGNIDSEGDHTPQTAPDSGADRLSNLQGEPEAR